jgi:hypothetical protein
METSPLPTGEEVQWAPEPVWILHRRQMVLLFIKLYIFSMKIEGCKTTGVTRILSYETSLGNATAA